MDLRRATNLFIFTLRMVVSSSCVRGLANLHSGPDPNEVKRAKELCEDLITSVRQQYEEHKSQPQPARFPGYGGQTPNVYMPSMSGQTQSGSPTPVNPGPPSGSQPPPPPPASASPPGTDATSAYANPYATYYGSDPYAAYGGYQAYLQYCEFAHNRYECSLLTQEDQAYYAQAQPGTGAAAPGTSASPPPPPGSNGSYNSVRPSGM
jgi:hypothetical protein